MKPKTLFPLALMLASTMAHAEEPCWLDVDEAPYEQISSEQALTSSEGVVLLHFGEGFPAHVIEGIILAVGDLDYRFCAFAGGTAEAMDLYIDGQRGKKPFSPADAMGFLLSVLDKNAESFRDLEPEQITARQALEWSEGRVLLHAGDDFSKLVLNSATNLLKEIGYSVVVARGGPAGFTNVYFFGNQIPKSYSPTEIGEMIATLRVLGERNNLIDVE